MTLKFFRRHSRIVLLAFMAVLMVVFVIGNAIGRGFGGGNYNAKIGTAFGEPVTLADLRAADRDFQVAASLGLVPLGLDRLQFVSDNARDVSLAICLLKREAQRIGIVIQPSQIKALLQQRGVNDYQFNTLRDRFGLSRDGMYMAAARILAVGVLFRQAAQPAMMVPLPQLQRAYRDFAQTARVKVSLLAAGAFIPQVPPPTEEQILAAFEAGKDRETSHTDEELVFGYKLPDRVQIEYLTVDPAAIEDLVMIREADARQFYEDHQSKYQKPAEGPLSIDTGSPTMVPQTYEEVRPQVREAVRSLEAIKDAQRLINAAHAEAAGPWELADKTAVDVDRLETFAALAQRFSKQYPVQYEKTGWLSRDEFNKIAVLAGSVVTIEGQRFTAADLAFHAGGLGGDDDVPEALPRLALLEPSPVLMTYRVNATGNTAPYQPVMFRVVGVKPSAPPASVDEVRDQVIADLKTSEAYKLAAAQANDLAEQAKAVGLDQAVAQAEVLKQLMAAADGQRDQASQPLAPKPGGYLEKLLPFEPPRFGRMPTTIRGIRSQLLHDKVFELFDSGKLTDGHNVLTVPDAKDTTWIVAEVLEVKPLYRGEFARVLTSLQQQASRIMLTNFQSDWCQIDNIKKRTGYVEVPAETQ